MEAIVRPPIFVLDREGQPELLRRVLSDAVAGDEAVGHESIESLIAQARNGKNLRAGRIIGEARAALSPPEAGGHEGGGS